MLTLARSFTHPLNPYTISVPILINKISLLCVKRTLGSIEKRPKSPIGDPALIDTKLQTLEHRRGARLSVFYRIYFGECETELHEVIPLSTFRHRDMSREQSLHQHVVFFLLSPVEIIISMTNSAHSGADSVRRLLTKNPTCSCNCHCISFERFPRPWQIVGLAPPVSLTRCSGVTP